MDNLAFSYMDKLANCEKWYNYFNLGEKEKAR